MYVYVYMKVQKVCTVHAYLPQQSQNLDESHPVPAQALPTYMYENCQRYNICVEAVLDFILWIQPIVITIMLDLCSSPPCSQRPQGDAQHHPLRPPAQLPLVRDNTRAVLP